MTLLLDKDKRDFKKLERALGFIHYNLRNPVKYHLVNNVLGWASHGKPDGRVVWCQIPVSNKLEILTLYIFFSPNQCAMQEFIDCVKANRPKWLKIIFDVKHLYDMFDIEKPYGHY